MSQTIVTPSQLELIERAFMYLLTHKRRIIGVGDIVGAVPTDYRTGTITNIEVANNINFDALEGRVESSDLDARLKEGLAALDDFKRGFTYTVRWVTSDGQRTVLSEPDKIPYDRLIRLDQTSTNKILQGLLEKRLR